MLKSPLAAVVLAMVSTVYGFSSSCPTVREGSAAGGGASVVTSERAGPKRFSTLRAAPCTFYGPTVSPLKCVPKPENEMSSPQPIVLYCLTDTRSEMGVEVRKWRGIESNFSVSLGVAWQRQWIVSKVVG